MFIESTSIGTLVYQNLSKIEYAVSHQKSTSGPFMGPVLGLVLGRKTHQILGGYFQLF